MRNRVPRCTGTGLPASELLLERMRPLDADPDSACYSYAHATPRQDAPLL